MTELRAEREREKRAIIDKLQSIVASSDNHSERQREVLNYVGDLKRDIAATYITTNTPAEGVGRDSASALAACAKARGDFISDATRRPELNFVKISRDRDEKDAWTERVEPLIDLLLDFLENRNPKLSLLYAHEFPRRHLGWIVNDFLGIPRDSMEAISLRDIEAVNARVTEILSPQVLRRNRAYREEGRPFYAVLDHNLRLAQMEAAAIGMSYAMPTRGYVVSIDLNTNDIFLARDGEISAIVLEENSRDADRSPTPTILGAMHWANSLARHQLIDAAQYDRHLPMVDHHRKRFIFSRSATLSGETEPMVLKAHWMSIAIVLRLALYSLRDARNKRSVADFIEYESSHPIKEERGEDTRAMSSLKRLPEHVVLYLLNSIAALAYGEIEKSR